MQSEDPREGEGRMQAPHRSSYPQRSGKAAPSWGGGKEEMGLGEQDNPEAGRGLDLSEWCSQGIVTVPLKQGLQSTHWKCVSLR